MKKRFLSIALALCMLLSIVPLTPIVVNASTTTYTLKNDTNGKLMYGNTAVDETGANGLTVTFDPDNEYAGDTNVTGYILNGGTAGATYKLGADVTINAPLIIQGGTKDNPVTLDLCGHVLKYENSNTDTKNSVIVVANDAYFVLQDTVTNPTTRYATKAENSAVYSVIKDAEPTSGDYLPVTGGIITGGTGTQIHPDDTTIIFGGGVFVGSKATFTMTGGSIVGCTAGDKDGSQGGGVFVSAGKSSLKNKVVIPTTFTMTGGSIVGCTANHGGGVYERGYAEFTMDGTNNARIASCTAENGGGVYVSSDNKFTMTGGTIENCAATNGGGVYVGGSVASVTMEGGSIKNCTAVRIGGGVYFGRGRFNMAGGTIENCAATNGGGVGINSDGTFTMTNGTIKDCAAKGNGMYIGTSGGIMDAQGGSVYGGVYISNSADGKLKNTSTADSTIFYATNGEAIDKEPPDQGNVTGQIVGKRVKFMKDEDTIYAETVAKSGGDGKISEPVAPTKAGNHFAGWYTAQTGGKEWNFSTAIDSTDTLYAGWHKLEKVDAKAATCKDTGNTEYWKCTGTNCGKLFEDSEGKKETNEKAVTLPIEPTNHASTQLLLIPAKEADCKNGGNNDYYYCASCDKYFKDAAGTTGTTAEAEKTDKNPANHEKEADEWTTKNETQHKKEWTCCHTVTVELENHEWNENGICTECGYGCIHSGGEATCKSKAKCEHCGNEYGEADVTNHTTLKHIEAKAATTEAEGNIEYWHCKDCKNNFSDKAGKNVIDLKDTVISKLSPEIIDGKGQSLTVGETRELTFRSNAAYSDFIRVEVDGKTVDGKNYTVKEGSTIVTLKADYVATLSVGEHTLGIVSESGTATTAFTVNAKAVNDNTAPATGDNSHMALWFALLFVSGVALIRTTVYGKKKKYSAK